MLLELLDGIVGLVNKSQKVEQVQVNDELVMCAHRT